MSVVRPPKDKSGSAIEAAKRIGFHVTVSKEGEERRKGFRDLCDELKKDVIKNTPEDSIEEVRKKLDTVVGMIREHAIPWGRAGSDPEFAKLVFLFEKMIGRGKNFLTTMGQVVKSYHEVEMEKESQEQNNEPGIKRSVYSTSWDTVHKVIKFMDVEVFARCLAVGEICWHERDVAEKEVIAVQQPIIPTRERADITDPGLFGYDEED